MACKYKYKGKEYNEQEFRTFVKDNLIPKVKQSGITPSIKGHAQFSTDNGIGWFRSDEQQNTTPNVILPIGTSGSGKSTFIKSLPQENLIVIEPDAMRIEFTGNINDKSKDKEIYIEASNRAIKAIKEGKQVVFDTTNLTKDKRLPFIEAIKKEIPNAIIQYKLMELDPELAKQRIKLQLLRGENRANVSDATIDRHAESYKQMLEDIKNEPISPFLDKPSKTRRILELQSDLFQKGRDSKNLINKRSQYSSSDALQKDQIGRTTITLEQFESLPGKVIPNYNKTIDTSKYPKEFNTVKDFKDSGLLNIGEKLNRLVYSASKYDNNGKEVGMINFSLIGDPTIVKIEYGKRDSSENQFLQLLNKDSNWVKFFIQSIIQDSAKKGYEKVLFPSGNTASKVEGHTTLEEFKKQKEDRIKELEEQKEEYDKLNKELKKEHLYLISYGLDEEENEVKKYFNTFEELRNFAETNSGWISPILEEKIKGYFKYTNTKAINNEINQLKQELERIETEGFGALRPIYNFYENQVKNILKKNYNVKEITDEYGNTWNEIEISPNMLNSILLQQQSEVSQKPIQELNNQLVNLLNKLGISSLSLEEYKQWYKENYNQDFDVNPVALADLTNKIIAIDKNLENITTLPEEVSHFIMAVVKRDNPSLYKKLDSQIESHPIYEKVFKKYINKYKGNKELVRFEALGKLLSQAVVDKFQEKKSIISLLKQALKDFISLFKEKSFTDELNTLANRILSNDFENTSVDFQEETLFQLDDQKEEIEKITKELESVNKSEIVKATTEFEDVVKTRLKKLINNKNNSKLKELFTTAYGVNTFETLNDLLKEANKAAEDDKGIFRRLRALALGTMQIKRLSELMLEDVKKMNNNPNSDALENLSTLQTYLNTLKDWEIFLKDARKTFDGNPKTIRLINDTLGTIEVIENNILKNDVNGVISAFRPLLLPASEAYSKVIQDEINREKNLLNNTKNPENKKIYQERIKQLEEKLEKFNFSQDKNIAAFLKGEYGDINVLSAFMDAYSDNPDPTVSAFAVWIKNQIQDVNTEVNEFEIEYLNEVAPLYDNLSRFNPEDVGKKLTFLDKRVDYEGNPYTVVSLLNPYKDFKADEQVFRNQIQALKDLIKNGEDVEENTKLLIEKNKEFSQWKMDYMHQEFTDEYYKKWELWEDSVGQALRQKVDEIFDKIRQIQLPSLLSGEELSPIDEAEIESYLKEYKLLGNVNKLDGSPKTNTDEDGNYTGELDQALKMREIRALNNKIFEWKDNNQAFEKAKQRHSEYIISQGLAEDSQEYLQSMQDWEDNNTRMFIKPEFYERRKEILEEINDILSVYKTEENTEDFAKIWDEILSIVYGYRDEDNQPIGTEIGLKGAERIKAAMERLEEIKNTVQQANGLSKNEQYRLSELISKSKSEKLNPSEKQELKELYDKQNKDNIPSATKRLSELFEELKDLQSKLPTEYYVEAFNNISQKYSVTLDNTGNVDSIPILKSPKLQQLLENEDFKNWFELNHIQVQRFNPETKQVEQQWERLYQWSRVIPNDASYIEIKPIQKYSVRVVKDEYKTKQIVGETVDNKGKFLPKLQGKDDRYINQEYFRLKNSQNPSEQNLFKLLEVHTKYLLKSQEDLANRNKLYLDVPRFLKTSTEKNLQILKELQEKPSSIPSTIWNNLKEKWNAIGNYNEGEGNFESVFADKTGNEYIHIPIKGTQNIDSKEVSLDLFRSIMKYDASATLNKQLVKAKPVADALQRIVGEPEHAPLNIAKRIKGALSKSPKLGTNNRQDAIRRIIKREFEGEQSKQELGKIGQKLTSLLKGATALKTIKLNIPGSIANVVNGEMQNFINSSNGYISFSDLGKAHSLFFSDFMPAFIKEYKENKINKKSLQSQLFDLYGFVSSHTYSENVGEKLSQSKIKDALSLAWLNNHREWGELFMQSVNAIAYLNATKVQQDNNTISLLQAYELDSQGKIKLKEGIDNQWAPNGSKFKELKEKIANHNSRVHGNYAKGIDKPEAETYTWFSIFIMMKRFFWSMAQNRFAASDVQFTKYGLKSKARFNIRSGGSEHGYLIKALDIAQKQLESKIETGNWETLTPDEKIAVIKSVTDMAFVYLAYLSLKYLFGFDPDDPDKWKKLKENDWITNQLIYQNARALTESSTFINPYQYIDYIASEPIPLKTLKDWLDLFNMTKKTIEGDQDAYYDKDYGLYEKGKSKAKAKALKVTGLESILKAKDEDQLVQDYLKLRGR